MTMNKKFGFRDARNVPELLKSARPPKVVTYIKSNPMSSKIRGLLKRASSSKAGSVFGRLASSAVGKAVIGVAGSRLALAINGKFNLTGRLGKALWGGQSAIAKVSTVAGAAAYGARIVEEIDPEKIRRPLREGISTNAAQRGLTLSQTAAASVLGSLISGVPTATPIPPKVREFKTPESLITSPRFFNAQNTTYTFLPTAVATAKAAVKHIEVSNTTAVLYPQSGLLEDEIFYRLVLLAENVYAPVARRVAEKQYAPLSILEGFRAENSGTSPHERGEAFDFTLGAGTWAEAAQLYELAIWMRDHVIYDELILCYSPVGNGQVWIHVSLTPDHRTRTVWTKMCNDTHREGLWLVQPYTDGRIEAEDRRISKEYGTVAQSMLSKLATRDTRLNPVDTQTVHPIQAINPLNRITTSGSVSGTSSGSTILGNCDGCQIIYPRPGVPTPEQVSTVVNGVRSELFALGLSFASKSDIDDWWLNGREGNDQTKYRLYQNELMKMQLITVVAVRRLARMGYSTVGLVAYDGASGQAYRSAGGRTPESIGWNDNTVNPYYDMYAHRIVEGTPELPEGLKLSPDGLMISKVGPEVDFLSSDNAQFVWQPELLSCYLGDFDKHWRNPFDGTHSNYPPVGTPGTVLMLTEGCTASNTTANVA